MKNQLQSAVLLKKMKRRRSMIQKIHKSIDIQAPVNRVFSYMEDPGNEPEWMESTINVKNISGSGPKAQYDCSWKMAGVQLHGHTTRMEDIPNKRIVDETRGDGTHTWFYTFEPHGDTTTVELDLKYNIPVPVQWRLAHEYIQRYTEGDSFMSDRPTLEDLIEKFIVRHTEREVEMDMQNVKEILEI